MAVMYGQFNPACSSLKPLFTFLLVKISIYFILWPRLKGWVKYFPEPYAEKCEGAAP